jgi:hypothetical protein
MGDKEQMSISISFSGKEPAIKKGRVHDVWAAVDHGDVIRRIGIGNFNFWNALGT